MVNRRGIFQCCLSLFICSFSFSTVFAEETSRTAEINNETTPAETQQPLSQNQIEQQHQIEMREKIKKMKETARLNYEQQLKEQQALQQQQIDSLTRHKSPEKTDNIHIESVKSAEPLPTTTPTPTKNSGGFPVFFIVAFGILGFIWWKFLRNNNQSSNRKRNRSQQSNFQQDQGASSQQRSHQHDHNSSQQSQQQPPLQTSDRVKTVLDDFFSDNPKIPMVYRDQLNDIQLDFSTESLSRLDQVIATIKNITTPDYEKYCEEIPYQQFVIFCGVYLGTTIARQTHQSIKWLSYDEMKIFMQRPEFPQTLGTFVSCMIGNEFHHLPIETICDGLFTESPENTCQERLSFYQKNARPLIEISEYYKNEHFEAQNDMEQAFVDAIKIGGFLAHHSLYMIENNAPLHPTIIQTNGGPNLIESLVGETASKRGREMLETNPNHYLRQVFVEDIFANLPRERIDALSINIRSHTPHQAKWNIIIPYQHNGQRFEFYTPIFSGSSTEQSINPLLFKAFWQGIHEFNSPTNTMQYYVASKQFI